jgi:cytochrome c
VRTAWPGAGRLRLGGVDGGNKAIAHPILLRHCKQELLMTGRLTCCSTVPQRTRAIFAVAATATMIAASSASAAGDATRGETPYQGCGDCHPIEKNDVGPLHKGVVGRVAGRVPGYNYSAALKNSGVIWTEDSLDKWLTSPQGFIPGTKMFYEVQDARDRADIIAFLKEKAR